MAVVSRFLDAANHHDADTIYATVHPDFESFQPLHPGRNFRGPGQLISNWKAIFAAEPGFRLTVLRASSTGNTVWVELHGAGDSAEAAGIFIVGVENARIRWVRVYSDLVESLPEPVEELVPAAEATISPAAAEATPEGGEPHTALAPVDLTPPSAVGDGGAGTPDLGTPDLGTPDLGTGRMETLVGHTGPVPVITIPDETTVPGDAGSEPDTGSEPGTGSETDAESEPGPLDLSGGDDEVKTRREAEGSSPDETAADGPEPVRSRWRKAFKRS